MAATTNRGITYTGTGTFTTAVDLDLPLWAGVDQDDNTWLSGSSYPGALTHGLARNTDGSNRGSARLVCLSLSAALAEGNTLTLSGEANTILSGIAHGLDSTANLNMSFSGLVCTFSVEQTTDGTSDDTSGATVWLIIS